MFFDIDVDVEMMLCGGSCDAWLARAVMELIGSPVPLDRVAGLGLLGRLGAPSLPEDAAEQVAVFLAGGRSVGGAVAEWAKTLAPQVVADIECMALDEVMALIDALELVHRTVALEDPLAASIASSFVRQRDDLESVRFVLRARGEGLLLNDALDSLDREACASLFSFSLALPHEEDSETDIAARWRAVSWQEPESWWGSWRL